MPVKGQGTVWSSSSWPSRWAACTATTHTLAGCITSGRATPSAWSVSTRLCTPRVSIAMAMAPAAKRISCCTGRQWGTIDAREPGGEFASWTLVPALLFTASCSSDFSWQSQQAPVCGSSRSQSNDFSVLEALLSLPFQRLQAVQGHLESSLSVCAPQFPKQSGCLGSADLFFSPERILSDLDDFLQIPPFLKGVRIYQITNQTKKAIRTQV